MIFISHVHRDLAAAIAVQDRLTVEGFQSWLDARAIPVGERFVESIGNVLERASAFILIDSEPACSSYWVSRELRAARRLANERGLPLIAIPAEKSSVAPDHPGVDFNVGSIEDALSHIPPGTPELQNWRSRTRFS